MATLTGIAERIVHQPFTKAIYDYLKGLLETGWVGLAGAFAWASTDGHTFTMTTAVDLTSIVAVGDRIRVNQAGNKYFIVTAIAFAAGTTTLTLYGGTDYTLLNAAIASVDYSKWKSPVGFPMRPDKWTETLTDAVSRNQASPVNGTWYNLGALQLAIPIGSWRVYWAVYAAWTGAAGQSSFRASLSSSSSSESDVELTGIYSVSNTAGVTRFVLWRTRDLILAAKTTYFLIGESDDSATSIAFTGAPSTVIRAVCAYL